MWHASGGSAERQRAERIAERALRGVGDPELGEWWEDGSPGSGVVHLRRRLAGWEMARYGITEVRDVRDTPEEADRLRRLLADAPQLRRYLNAEGRIG